MLITWLLSEHVSHLKCSLPAWSFKFHSSTRTSAATSDAVGLEGGQIPYLVALMLMASGHLGRRFAKVHNFALFPRESKERRVGVAKQWRCHVGGNSIRNKQMLLKTCNNIAAAKALPNQTGSTTMLHTDTHTCLSVCVAATCCCAWASCSAGCAHNYSANN